MDERVDLDDDAHADIFNLATIRSRGGLEKVSDVNLDANELTAKAIAMDSDDESIAKETDSEEEGGSEEESNIDRLEREMEAGYETYLKNTSAFNRAGTKAAKRSKKLARLKAQEALEEDEGMIDGDGMAYAKLLAEGSGAKDSDDSSGDTSSDDGFFSDEEDLGNSVGKRAAVPDGPWKETKKKKDKDKDKKKKKRGNPLLVDLEGTESADVTAKRWFSNPLFDGEGEAEEKAESSEGGESDSDVDREESSDSHNDDDDDDDDGDDDDDDTSNNLNAESVISSMPKTEKQKRHEARVKAKERMERRDSRRAKAKGEGFEVTKGGVEEGGSESDDDDDGDGTKGGKEQLASLDEKSRKRIMEARRLIAAGMGAQASAKEERKGFEIAPTLTTFDERKYGSDDEDYDSDDHARTLAIGTMMLRKSSQKALVDASYNRFAWNDPVDLPDWFQDDEKRHYRPQLPIPEALVRKMKEKFIAISEKPIKKVAEARARKSKRANAALKAAKAKAAAVAKNSEMSEAQKLRAISKAMKGKEVGAPGKSYVVAKKGKGRAQGGKGVKLVDKREKSDKRGMKRAMQRGKKKGGGLVGGKKRRHHK